MRRVEGMVFSIRFLMITSFLVSFPIYSFVQAAQEPTDVAALLAGAPKMGPAVIYHFSEHLAEAEASVLPQGKAALIGTWQQDRFVFPGLSGDPEIKLKSATYNKGAEEGILFQPADNAVKRLRFKEVPPGSVLVLDYGIEDVSLGVAEASPIFLRIKVGKHELKRLRISHEAGWKKQDIDLGILSFLKRPVPVTFEVFCDNNAGRRFSFRAEIKQ